MWPYCYKNDSYYDTINKENEENGKKNAMKSQKTFAKSSSQK